jgi:NodT family efflux transporter outer membrane factor (OMF) lipoprotein
VNTRNPAVFKAKSESALRHQAIVLSIMLLSTLVVLAGCSTTLPLAPTLKSPVPGRYQGSEGTVGQAVDEHWWTSFADKELAGLIEQALAANQDIGMAVARVRAARAGFDAQASRALPTLGIQASASRNDSGLPESGKQGGQPDTRTYRAGLELAWEVDLAGGVRAARSAAGADAQAAQSGLAGARLLVASEVARQYFILRGAERKLEVVKALAAAQRETARLVASREREGQASRFDVSRAEAEASSFEAQLPPLRSLIGTSLNRLAVLTAADATVKPWAATTPYAWPVATAIAIGQPSDLLRRRPDVMAAEQRYAAETLRGDESRAQLWPKVFLGALLGREDLRLNALDLAPVRFSSVALAFSMPLLNRSRVLAGIEAQSARADEALLSWQKSVLVAIEEVEDSLLLRSQEIARGGSLQAAVQLQHLSLQRALSLRGEGQIDLLALLDVQRSLLAAELALADSQSQQALADVQLYKALGGGWAPAAAATLSQDPAIRTSLFEGIHP